MHRPRIWVIKSRETLADGSDGWHWREYLPSSELRPYDQPLEDWGGSDLIRSANSKKLLRDEVASGDIGICYQLDDPGSGRSILGFTRFVSGGKEACPGSGDFNCFDLCPPIECCVLTPPLRIDDLFATGCLPRAFSPRSQATILSITPDEFQGILRAIDRYAPKVGISLRNWVRAAEGGKAPVGRQRPAQPKSGTSRPAAAHGTRKATSNRVAVPRRQTGTTVDIVNPTPISAAASTSTPTGVPPSTPKNRVPRNPVSPREPAEAPALEPVFHPRVNTGFAPDEPFRKLLVAVHSEKCIRWTRKQVLAAFRYQKLGSTVADTITSALSQRGVRLTPGLERVGAGDALWLERVEDHFATKQLAEQLKKELALLAAGRARLRYRDLLLFCGMVRDGPQSRQHVKAMLKAAKITVKPAIGSLTPQDWLYLSIPVQVPPPRRLPPAPTRMSFAEARDLADKYRKQRGIEWRSKQKELTERFIQGHHTFGVLPCGTGKSLAFQITADALQKRGLTLVVSPLIALITDIAKHPVPGVTTLNSTVSEEDCEARLRYLAEGRYHLLYLTPEQLGSAALLRLLTRPERPVVRVAIDEAHCVSEWGQSFRVEYLLLRDALAKLGRPPVLLLTATAPPEVRRDVVTQLGIDLDLDSGKDLILDYWRKDELVPSVVRVRGLSRKYRALREFVAAQGPATRGIVYTRFATAGDNDDRENVREIGEWLESKGFGPVAYYHGQLDPATRAEQQRRFTSGEARIAVATNAFGLGIDLPDIDWIVHFYMPPSLLDYYQEIGRGAHGRHGSRCKCMVTYDPEDRKVVEGLVLSNIASAGKIALRFRQLVEGRGRQHGLRGPHEMLYDPARKVLLLPFRPMKKQFTVRIAHMLALQDIGVLSHLPQNLFRGDNVYAQFQLVREALTPADMDALTERQQSRRNRVVSRLDAMQKFCEMSSDAKRWAILDAHFSS